MFNSNAIVFIDGDFLPASEVKVDIFSQTLHYGYGLFEGMRAYNTREGARIFKARQHFERFQAGAKQMNLPLPYTLDEMVALSYQLIEKNGLIDAYIRPLLFAGPNMGLTTTLETHLLLSAWKWGRLLGDSLVHLTVSSFRRPDPRTAMANIKACGNYVNAISATSEARVKGFHDAILLDVDNFVAEAAGANLFMEKDDVLYTPRTTHIVDGITRQTVIKLARDMKVKVVEKDLTVEDLHQADGVFLAGTAAEIVGVETIERAPFRLDWEDTLGYVLSRKYRKLVTLSDSYTHTLI